MLLCLTSCSSNPDQLKEGDIVFQIGKSEQSKMITEVTGSKWTHCGIIVYKDNKPYVLEAVNVVKLTELNNWIDRGADKEYKVKRETSDVLKINYSNYLGIAYDYAFKFDNDKWYCSELVYVIYYKQFNIKLCEPKKVKDFDIEKYGSVMKERGISAEQLVVAPSDLL